MDAKELAGALADLLANEAAGGLAARGVGAAIDWLLERPVAELLDPDVVAEQALAALTGPGLETLAGSHLEEIVAQERARVEESGETLAAWVPGEILAAVDERLGRPAGLPAGWFDDAVDPNDVRALLTGAISDTLDYALDHLPFAKGAGGLFGSFARGATAAGGGLLGALGAGLQNGLRKHVRDLSGQSAAVFRERMGARLATKEGKETFARIRHQIVSRLLELPVAAVYAAADDPGAAVLGRWAYRTLDHNLARPEIRAAIADQLRAALGREADTPLRELLDTAGLLPGLRDALVTRGAALAAKFAASDALRGWLDDALAAALGEDAAD